jgi:hypothetical protein
MVLASVLLMSESESESESGMPELQSVSVLLVSELAPE